MAVYDLEEQERIAALKDWWDRWGNWVYAGLIAFFIAVLAAQGYRYYQRTQTEEAYTLFKSVQTTAQEAAASKDYKKLSAAATALVEKYPSTFFATEAQFLAAKAAFDHKDLTLAKTHLQWVVDKGRATHVNIARLRLGAVLLDEKKYDDALKLLEQVKEDGFESMTADLRGDIFAAQGRRDDARAAYQIAVEKAEARNPLKAISQAKLDASGGASAKPDSASAEKKADDKDAGAKK